jgi:hypothetical protein
MGRRRVRGAASGQNQRRVGYDRSVRAQQRLELLDRHVAHGYTVPRGQRGRRSGRLAIQVACTR